MINLEYIAARIANGTVDADEIKSIVDSLLVDGIYADEFIDIMESKPARIDDVFPPSLLFYKGKGSRSQLRIKLFGRSLAIMYIGSRRAQLIPSQNCKR